MEDGGYLFLFVLVGLVSMCGVIFPESFAIKFEAFSSLICATSEYLSVKCLLISLIFEILSAFV